MATNVMVDTTDSALHKAPESFNGICVDVAHDVNLLVVLNPPMPVPVCCIAYSVVNVPLIREHGTFRHNVFSDDRQQSCPLDVFSGEGSDSTPAFSNAKYRSLGIARLSSRTHLLNAAHVCLVHLHSGAALATELLARVVFIQHGSNLLEHPPRSRVGNACLALDLFGGDAATGLRHQVDRIEPNCQRCRRFVKDRVSGRMVVIPAVITGI